MTVQQLIDELKMMPSDLEVKFAYPSRDYWHSTIAGDVQNVEEGAVVHSEYHSAMVVVDQDDEEEVEKHQDDAACVVLLT
jgi:hypothetical protein